MRRLSEEEEQQEWLLPLKHQGELPWIKEQLLHTHFIFISLFWSNIYPPTTWHSLFFIAPSTDFCTELKWEMCRNVLVALKQRDFLKNPGSLAAGAAACCKRGQVLLLLCCPKHISLFAVKHILQNPHFLLAPNCPDSAMDSRAVHWTQKNDTTNDFYPLTLLFTTLECDSCFYFCLHFHVFSLAWLT